VQFVRNLAKKQGSTALAQLASQMSSIIRLGNRNGEDVFAKVKGLIADMIEKLEAEARLMQPRRPTAIRKTQSLRRRRPPRRLKSRSSPLRLMECLPNRLL